MAQLLLTPKDLGSIPVIGIFVKTGIEIEEGLWELCIFNVLEELEFSVTGLGDLLDFRQLFKDFGNN